MTSSDHHRVSGPNRHAGSTILERWEITPDELTAIVDKNPSLRGMLSGYVAEMKLAQLLQRNPDVESSIKHDDHDRKKKSDRVIRYRGREFAIEVKSLQSNSIRRDGDSFLGKAQVDASDKRTVTLPDGSTLDTTLLLVDQFDILAVSLFTFEETWRFVFAKNRDLPRSTYRRYTPQQRNHLLASLVTVTWPPRPPFYDNLFLVLDGLLRDARG